MTSIRNGLSLLLAGALVLHAGCACARVIDGAAVEPHAHHHPSEQVIPADDCTHADCAGDCDKAAEVAPGKGTAQPNHHKFGLDSLTTAAVDFDLYVVGGLAAATGPPIGRIPKILSTPVLRFDLLLE
jgi:hypothetical protein